MEQQQIKTTLDCAFPGLSQAELDGLAQVERVVTYPSGTVIFEEGSIGNTLLEALFELFHRVGSTGGHLFGGVGLGLPIAKHVVELHGGDIRAERRLEGGSRFTVTLPIPASMV